MVQIYKAKPQKSAPQHLTLTISRLDHEGKGVAFWQQQAVFVEGALPGEQVKVQVQGQHNKVLHGQLQKVLSPSPARITPFCPHYQRCGGCQLQHLAVDEQISAKQQALDVLFKKMTPLTELPWQTAIAGPEQSYRRAARLATDWQQGQWQVGFRQKQQKAVVAIDHCPLLEPALNQILAALPALFAKLKHPKGLGHVQLLAGDSEQALLLRVTAPLSTAQRQLLEEFAAAQGCQLWLQGNEQLEAVQGSGELHYQVAELDLTFTPENFVQVNRSVNQQMVAQALDWLALQHDDRVLDLFCGMGNFSLPIAKRVASVLGLEGEAHTVAQAQRNAQHLGIENAEFISADLCEIPENVLEKCNNFNKLLLDPSRPGAKEILSQLPLYRFGAVLYVSCDPVTLARDTQILLANGLKLKKISLLNMFPHTGHVETMALFTRSK